MPAVKVGAKRASRARGAALTLVDRKAAVGSHRLSAPGCEFATGRVGPAGGRVRQRRPRAAFEAERQLAQR